MAPICCFAFLWYPAILYLCPPLHNGLIGNSVRPWDFQYSSEEPHFKSLQFSHKSNCLIFHAVEENWLNIRLYHSISSRYIDSEGDFCLLVKILGDPGFQVFYFIYLFYIAVHNFIYNSCVFASFACWWSSVLSSLCWLIDHTRLLYCRFYLRVFVDVFTLSNNDIVDQFAINFYHLLTYVQCLLTDLPSTD